MLQNDNAKLLILQSDKSKNSWLWVLFGGRRLPSSQYRGREEVETRKFGRNETRTFQGLFLGCTRVSKKPGKSPTWMFRFPWNWPGRRTVRFCFSGGNEAPGFPRFLSGFVSIPSLKVSAPQEIFLRISLDHGLVGAITEILIGSGVRVQIHGDPV